MHTHEKKWIALLAAILLLSGCQAGPPANSTEYSKNSEAESLQETSTYTMATVPTSEESGASEVSSATGKFPGTQGKTLAGTTKKSSVSVVTRANSTETMMDELAKAPRWKQTKFYLSTFNATAQNQMDDVYRRCLTANKEAGINLIENAIMSTQDLETCMDICEELGLDFLAQDLSRFSGIGGRYPTNNADTFNNVVEKYARYKHMVGYFLWDEPDEANFKKYTAKQNMFHKLDPGSLCYGLLLPSYGAYVWDPKNMEDSAYKRYVDNFVANCDPDVLSVDYYPLQKGTESLMENNLWRDIGYFRYKALEAHKPLWFYFQASKFQKELTDAQIQVQMYSALAYGTVGLSYYSTSGILTDMKGNKTARFEGLKQINARVLHLGKLLFKMKPQAIYHTGLSAELVKAYSLNTMGDAACPFKTAPDGLIISTFISGKDTYLVVVNKDYTRAVSGTLTLTHSRTVGQYDKATDKTSSLSGGTERINLSIPAGDCVVYCLG